MQPGDVYPDERRHHEARGRMRLQAPLEPARRHRRIHEVVQDRQEPAEVGLLLDAGPKMPAGSLTRSREIFFKKCAGGIDNRFALGLQPLGNLLP